MSSLLEKVRNEFLNPLWDLKRSLAPGTPSVAKRNQFFELAVIAHSYVIGDCSTTWKRFATFSDHQ